MTITLNGTTGETFPSWTTAGRPASPTAGQTGYNSTLGTLERYNGSTWGPFVTTSDTGTVTQTMLALPFTAMTAQASTSGTSIDFTGIPAGVKRITVMFNGVSANATFTPSIVLGSAGTFETSGYSSGSAYAQAGNLTGASNLTSGYIVATGAAAADTVSGNIIIANVGGNTWISSGVLSATTANYVWMSGGSKTLSATLDRVRVTISAGTFDAGSINILYE